MIFIPVDEERTADLLSKRVNNRLYGMLCFRRIHELLDS